MVLQNLFAINRNELLDFSVFPLFLTNLSMILIIMRGCSDHFDITEELASVHRSPVRGIATVKDISQEAE